MEHTGARSVVARNKLDGEVFAFMFSCRFATSRLDRVVGAIETGIACVELDCQWLVEDAIETKVN